VGDSFDHWRNSPWISGVCQLAGDALWERFHPVHIPIDCHDQHALASELDGRRSTEFSAAPDDDCDAAC
jgi:hypothetical protein